MHDFFSKMKGLFSVKFTFRKVVTVFVTWLKSAFKKLSILVYVCMYVRVYLICLLPWYIPLNKP